MKTLIALSLGTLAYLLTREVVVGLLVAAAGFWFLQQRDRQRSDEEDLTSAMDTRRPRYSKHERGIPVVCKQVTPERQEWVSVKTGRLFDVLSPDGPPSAKPGDPGEVFVSGARYTVKVPSGTRH